MATPAEPVGRSGPPPVPRSSPDGPPTAGPPDEPDWPVQATNAIVNVVDQVRDKTTGPVLTAARGAVFGLVVAVLAVIIVILALIFLVRLLDELLPSGVWLPYLLLGLLFTITGALVFRRRHMTSDVL